MNSLKNIMIIAVLAAVGYGVYVSLSRSSIDSGITSDDPTDNWSNSAKTNDSASTAKTKSSTSHPLALGGSASQSNDISKLGGSSSQSNDISNTSANSLGGATKNAVSDTGVTNLAPPLAQSPSDSTEKTTDSTTTEKQPDPQPGTVRNIAPPPEVSMGGDAVAATHSDSDAMVQKKFIAFMTQVQKTLEAGKLAEAHLALSNCAYPDLQPDEAKKIVDLLDQLAGTVIYSRQHLLEPAYRTQPGDTIEKVAQKHEVPWQLLAKINGLMPPDAANTEMATKDAPLEIGADLKVIRGPFNASIRLGQRELVLTIPDRATGLVRYAGRFSIGVGADNSNLPGVYTICTKLLNPTYRGPDGMTVGPNDPKNPYGDAWIGLSERIGIHGTDNPQNIGRDTNRGNICVGRRDLQDLYGILSVGSRVTITR